MNSCKHCGLTLTQKRFSSGVLEAPSMLRRRKFCDQRCMAAAMEKDRCKSASHSRQKAALMAKPACEVCKATMNLHVHHQDHDPLNNAPSNLRTLCASCHRRSHSPNFTETGEQRKPCRFCEAPSVKLELCFTHISRLKRFGHPLAKKRKIGSDWVLMLHDGERWLPFPSKLEPATAWDACAPTATRSSPRKPKRS